MTHAAQTNDTRSDLSALLRAEHARLDAHFESLADGFRADPRSAGLIEWKRFEAALLAHLNVEEDLVLPAFRRQHPLECALIRDEHAGIRRDLDELGLGVELHLVSAELLDRFIAKLRAHAAREDGLLYQFVEHELADETRTKAIGRVRDAARRLFGREAD